MSKLKRSAGGFGEDFILSQMEMNKHNYRIKRDPLFLVNIIKLLQPQLDEDIANAIIKSINEQPKPKLGAKRAFENENIVEEYKAIKKAYPERTSKGIREELAVKYKRNDGENIRKLLEKEGFLPHEDTEK